jgi:hypothetical protein
VSVVEGGGELGGVVVEAEGGEAFGVVEFEGFHVKSDEEELVVLELLELLVSVVVFAVVEFVPVVLATPPLLV